MSVRQYVDAMERLGIKPQTVLTSLQRHADYVRDNGLPIGTSPGMHSLQESEEARKYAMECSRMVQEEACRRAVDEWRDQYMADQMPGYCNVGSRPIVCPDCAGVDPECSTCGGNGFMIEEVWEPSND